MEMKEENSRDDTGGEFEIQGKQVSEEGKLISFLLFPSEINHVVNLLIQKIILCLHKHLPGSTSSLGSMMRMGNSLWSRTSSLLKRGK